MPLESCPAYLSQSPVHPVAAAAWVLGLGGWLRDVRAPKSGGRAVPGARAGSNLRNAYFVLVDRAGLTRLNERECIGMTHRAVETLLSYAPAEALEPWMKGSGGKQPPLVTTFGHLVDRLALDVDLFQEWERRAPVLDRERECEAAGMLWWNVVDELSVLRALAAAARTMLPQSDRLPESELPLDKRWRCRAALALDELDLKLGASLDIPIPKRGPRPASNLIGGRLLTSGVIHLDGVKLVTDRLQELRLALELLNAPARAGGIPISWKRTRWFTAVMQKAGKRKLKGNAIRLQRAAKQGELGGEHQGWRRSRKRVWEFEVGHVAGAQVFSQYAAALKAAAAGPGPHSGPPT